MQAWLEMLKPARKKIVNWAVVVALAIVTGMVLGWPLAVAVVVVQVVLKLNYEKFFKLYLIVAGTSCLSLVLRRLFGLL